MENGITSTYAYDADGRLTSLVHGAVETITYTYDNMHRRTGESRSSAPARTFGYDLTGQLTAVNQSSGNSTFTYDAVGNRTLVAGAPGAGSYTANNLNQYTTAGGIGALTYDANGNLATGGGWTYTHNGNSRLVGVAGPANVTASFARDGRSRDVKRTINGVTTYLIYDGWNLVAEYNSAGVLTTQYIHSPRVDEILTKVTPTTHTFPLADALGSTIAVTDASGAVLERVYYSDAFGTPTFKDASGTTLAGTTTGTRFLFTGREWLAALSLYDYRNRTYSAELGRFVQADPIRFKAGDVNLYRYVGNNAVSSVDPMGLKAEMICNRCPESGRMKCKTVENGKTSDVFPTNCGENTNQIDPGQYKLKPKPKSQMEPGNRDIGPQNFNGGKVQRGNSGEAPEYPEGTPSVTGDGLEPGQPHAGTDNIRVHGPGRSDGCITTDRAGEIQDMMDRNPGMKLTITDTECVCENGQLVPLDP